MVCTPVQRSRLAVLTAVVGVIVAGCAGGAPPAAPAPEAISQATLLTSGDAIGLSWDATPSPDGGTIFFTATGGAGGSGVFQVPAAGGTAAPVATGAPFQAPLGIAASTDGKTLFVAEPQAPAAAGKVGQVYAVPAGGGAPTPVAGTAGTAPRGLEVARDGDHDTLYFTGKDAADGQPGVFKVSTVPAQTVAPVVATTVHKGGPLVSPDAVTVTKAGVAIVTDRGVPGSTSGQVVKLAGADATKIADFRPPQFAGVALTLDDSLLLVSSLNPDKATDQVLVVDLKSMGTTVFDKVIGENREGGGLHRAYQKNVFAWADVQRPGRIYRVDP